MAAIQSLKWLLAFSGLGYFLLQAVTPNENASRDQLLSNDPNKIKESRKKQELFALILKGDTKKLNELSNNNKPLSSDIKTIPVKQN